MRQLYYILAELIKSYHVQCKYDTGLAADTLAKINDYRRQIVTIAEQREIFVDQIDVGAIGAIKKDVFFTRDDLDSLVVRMIGDLPDNTLVSLVQQGTRQNIFTRNGVAWPMLMSDVQAGTILGSQIPFDFPQEIYLQKSDTLDIGIVDPTDSGDSGFIFVHGANLKDDPASGTQALFDEINITEFDRTPNIPRTQLVPIQFQFTDKSAGNPAIAVDGGKDIFSTKNERSVILTEVSCNVDSLRVTLIDRGRNQEICETVEMLGIAARSQNPFTSWYPLPYPHLLKAQDRIQFRALNGSSIATAEGEDADVVYTWCFRGFTI